MQRDVGSVAVAVVVAVVEAVVAVVEVVVAVVAVVVAVVEAVVAMALMMDFLPYSYLGTQWCRA